MFFEGSEKKAEIIIDSQQLSLLDDFSDDFWTTLVKHCDAVILSHISNSQCKAFLLSESSLFIWNDRLLILTCGTTRLVNAIEYFLGQVEHKAILQLIYQRKNEYFSPTQPSHFVDDIKRLEQQLSGVAYRFGELDGHHNYLYHLDNDYQADADDITYELLAYQISEAASAQLSVSGLSTTDIRQVLQISQWLAGFTIDDHVFEPFGYSLNAIKDDKYVTIHVTPQATSSYVSFESNLDLLEEMPQILAILQPASFDLVSFNESQFASRINQLTPTNYSAKTLARSPLFNGFEVCFASYMQPQQQFSAPTRLNLSGDDHAF
ncbi:MAG: S-adenosylmethionine decarboxylase [Alteromonadaceae bacterium]